MVAFSVIVAFSDRRSVQFDKSFIKIKRSGESAMTKSSSCFAGY